MTGDETQVEPAALRACADTWFPEMVTATDQAKDHMRSSMDQTGSAFGHLLDVVNGATWYVLMGQFTDALHKSAARLSEAQVALRAAADSYEDADGKSAKRIKATQ